MKNLYKWSFVHSLGILVYVSVVGTIMQNGDRLFGEKDNFLTPVAVLLMFSLSALVVGGLAIGKPIMLYIDGKKKDAVVMLALTAGWLFVFTCITLIVSALAK